MCAARSRVDARASEPADPGKDAGAIEALPLLLGKEREECLASITSPTRPIAARRADAASRGLTLYRHGHDGYSPRASARLRRAPGGDARVRVAVRRGGCRRLRRRLGGSGKHRSDATRAVPRQTPPPGREPAATRARPAAEEAPQRPEETRVMPILPPSQAQAGMSPRERRAQLKAQQDRLDAQRRTTPPTPPPVAPPPGHGRSRRGFRFRFRYVWLLLLLWLVFLLLVPLLAWNKVSKIDAMPDGTALPTSRARRRCWWAATPAPTSPGRAQEARHRVATSASAPTRSCCCTPAPGPTC